MTYENLVNINKRDIKIIIRYYGDFFITYSEELTIKIFDNNIKEYCFGFNIDLYINIVKYFLENYHL